MSELTEDQKLVKLGLRSPNQTISVGSELLEQLKSNIADNFDTFQENFEDANLGSFDDLETWLVDNGFDSSTASNIRNNFEQKYESFTEFNTTVIDDLGSWEDFENEFSSGSGLRSDRQTDNGLSAAGVKVYEESGVGRDGQSISSGGVEVYGSEIHFSQSSAVQDTKDESAGSQDPIVWSNLSVSKTTASLGEFIEVEADVDSNISYSQTITATLNVDGNVEDRNTITLSANGSATVSFDWPAGASGGDFEAGTYEVGISKAGTKDVTVVFPQLI